MGIMKSLAKHPYNGICSLHLGALQPSLGCPMPKAHALLPSGWPSRCPFPWSKQVAYASTCCATSPAQHALHIVHTMASCAIRSSYATKNLAQQQEQQGTMHNKSITHDRVILPNRAPRTTRASRTTGSSCPTEHHARQGHRAQQSTTHFKGMPRTMPVCHPLGSAKPSPTK
eukprot:1144159-Pelagomonas_calceolata.AAC.2